MSFVRGPWASAFVIMKLIICTLGAVRRVGFRLGLHLMIMICVRRRGPTVLYVQYAQYVRLAHTCVSSGRHSATNEPVLGVLSDVSGRAAASCPGVPGRRCVGGLRECWVLWRSGGDTRLATAAICEPSARGHTGGQWPAPQATNRKPRASRPGVRYDIASRPVCAITCWKTTGRGHTQRAARCIPWSLATMAACRQPVEVLLRRPRGARHVEGRERMPTGLWACGPRTCGVPVIRVLPRCASNPWQPLPIARPPLRWRRPPRAVLCSAFCPSSSVRLRSLSPPLPCSLGVLGAGAMGGRGRPGPRSRQTVPAQARPAGFLWISTSLAWSR